QASLGAPPQHAAQLPSALRKRAMTAAICYAKGGKAAQAVELFLGLGEKERAVETLERAGDAAGAARLRASARTPAPAALSAALSSVERDVRGFQLEHMLTAFVRTGPQDEAELEAFYLLARLYERHDFLENAKEALEKLVQRAPNHRDAAQRLAALEAQTRTA